MATRAAPASNTARDIVSFIVDILSLRRPTIYGAGSEINDDAGAARTVRLGGTGGILPAIPVY
jgi:hypothetical protein